MEFTPEQAHAIERRKGDMLLDAGAGSGKTMVLVERFARAVVEDHIEVGSILTITFTEKAAAELRRRIRTRLRAVGDDAAALATEGAWISTIHGFCARVLRTHALTAGLDPNFAVLDEHEAASLREAAIGAALTELARTEAGADLIAAHGPAALRNGIIRVHAELRAQGAIEPRLPAGAQLDDSRIMGARSAERCRLELLELAQAVARELESVVDAGTQVSAALETLARVPRVLGGGVPWPGELDVVKLPRGSAKALRSDACERYRDAWGELRGLAAADHALDALEVLDELLRLYGNHYAQLKRERAGLDFEDLELFALEVLKRKDIGRSYRERFARVMVDEMQDTNRVQFALIELIAGVDLFMVGDAQQSIYGFRHADVELFEQRGRKLEQIGARASLQTNFRSRPEILTAINAAFETALGEQFRSLLPGREVNGSDQARVELLIVDKDAVTATDDPELLAAAGGATIWRLAEARALAARIAELVGSGAASAGEVVLLARATTDMQVYERALADAGLPTYVIGGRGYWQQPQVIQLTCYLRALANPLDLEAWQTTLLSPLCGLSLDGLVLVAAGDRQRLRDDDRARLDAFESWFVSERVTAARLGAEALLERALEFSGYDITVIALADGRRRLANVRKLMRIAREWEAANGPDLRGFLTLVRERASSSGGRESEAPVEGESVDAVRLMTIHRSKGLEFPVVCVADLGRRRSNAGGGLIRLSRDGRRVGVQIKRPGSGERIGALWYDDLRDERSESEDAEERRLFYVAMTRAQERLIVSGAACFNDWDADNSTAPIGWIGSAFVPDIASRTQLASVVADAVGAQAGAPPFTTGMGVKVTLISRVPPRAVPATAAPQVSPPPASQVSPPAARPPARPSAEPPGHPHPHLHTLSYTALSTYEKCGYRFYAEHLLGLPPPPRITAEPAGGEPATGQTAAVGGEQAAERGTEIHRVLAQVDFRRPVVPLGTPAEVRPLIARFMTSPTFSRLATLNDVRREQRFAFSFQDVLITGIFDVLALDPRTGGALVVDYKSDRLGPSSPAEIMADRYQAQRTIYALAALKLGVPGVEVFHLFLERTDNPVVAVYTLADVRTLEADLEARIAGPLAGDFAVTQEPGRRTCHGCPAAGGICSWPAADTER